MQLTSSATVNRSDWQTVLAAADLANTFHTPEYFDIQTSLGHPLVYACAYVDGQPVGVIVGVRNLSGYHQGLIEIGTKSGGYPLMIHAIEQRADAAEIKNQFLADFARANLVGQQFLFYPDVRMSACLFDDPAWGCVKQFDATAFLDLDRAENDIWMGLGVKCRNAVRYGQRAGVTARIANERSYFDRFYHFYKEIRLKRGTQYIGYDELLAKFEAFTQNGLADLWVAFHGETPLAYAFIWKYQRIINFVYGSSDDASWPVKANNVIQWELIRYYHQQGYTMYNMWGVRNMNLSEPPHANPAEIEGYGKFKLSFGAELRDLTRYVRVYE